MHICYVTGGLPYSPGETFITPEILELQRRGIALTVVPLHPSGPIVHEDARRLLPITVRQRVLSVRIFVEAALEALTHARRTSTALRRVVRSRNARILAKNLFVFPKGLWLGRLARRRGVSHIHAHWAGCSSTIALVASEVAGIPWSFTAHRWDIDENNLIEEKARTATFVRAIDERGGGELAANMGPHRGKLRVIHVGVCMPAPRDDHLPGRAAGPLRLIMAATFTEKKGHRYALEAMERVTRAGLDVVLDLAGTDGSILEETRQRAHALGLGERARFLGVVPHDEILRGFEERRWDAALLPSIVTAGGQKEGIPVSLMEAMVAGIPVITTDTGGIAELVTPGTGIIVPPKDPDALAEAIGTLSRDPALRQQLGRAASRRAREAFEIGGVADRLLAEMKLGERGAASGTRREPRLSSVAR